MRAPVTRSYRENIKWAKAASAYIFFKFPKPIYTFNKKAYIMSYNLFDSALKTYSGELSMRTLEIREKFLSMYAEFNRVRRKASLLKVMYVMK